MWLCSPVNSDVHCPFPCGPVSVASFTTHARIERILSHQVNNTRHLHQRRPELGRFQKEIELPCHTYKYSETAERAGVKQEQRKLVMAR